jgi:hypothetical protein
MALAELWQLEETATHGNQLDGSYFCLLPWQRAIIDYFFCQIEIFGQ